MKKQINGKKVDKYWGYELWIHNSELYCGKLLVFNKNSKFSMHYHMLKEETWYVSKGKFEYRWIDTNTAIEHNKIVSEGDIIHIERGKPHQLESLEEIGEIFEVSTQHFDEDSYRIRLCN
jgi:mannose-6-phosphate isomerase-like protein (cupin superfamily)